MAMTNNKLKASISKTCVQYIYLKLQLHYPDFDSQNCIAKCFCKISALSPILQGFKKLKPSDRTLHCSQNIFTAPKRHARHHHDILALNQCQIQSSVKATETFIKLRMKCKYFFKSFHTKCISGNMKIHFLSLLNTQMVQLVLIECKDPIYSAYQTLWLLIYLWWKDTGHQLSCIALVFPKYFGSGTRRFNSMVTGNW